MTLVWLVTRQRDIDDLDTDLIRRMVVLKIRVDPNGITAGRVRWRAGHQPRPFGSDHWHEPVRRRNSTSQTSVR
jgi:hypothetical protein